MFKDFVDRLLPIRRKNGSNPNRGMILCYHGIGDVSVDPWELFVSADHFREQMGVLNDMFTPISLNAMNEGLHTGNLVDRSVVVTFDDAYANNLYEAYPILEATNTPGTIFAVSNFVGSSHEFWWDELEQIILRPGDLPERLSLTIDGHPKEWDLGAATAYSQDDFANDRYAVAPDGRAGARMKFYRSVWEAIFGASAGEYRSALDQLAQWCGYTPRVRDSHRPMTLDELKKVDDTTLVDIGGHGRDHLPLGEVPQAVQREDIEQSRIMLERMLGHEIPTFCFPYGSHTKKSSRLVKEAGFQCGCTCIETPVTSRSSAYRLPRFVVRDMDGDSFARQLEEWIAG